MCGSQAFCAYHPQTVVKSEVVNCGLEAYLRCMVGDIPKSLWLWLSLTELWYNISFHAAINMPAFQALYGILPPIHIPYFPKDSIVEVADVLLRDRKAAIQLLKHHFSRAQYRMVV